MGRLALLATLAVSVLAAQSPDRWIVAQNSNFEIYSQASGETASKALTWFGQLRTFFKQNGLLGANFNDHGLPALRVIGFRSEREYEEFRLRPAADAFYASDGTRDYIVLAGLLPGNFNTAAHEYAHYVLHASGLKLPPWLNEGLAEFFSTLRLNGNAGRYELGGGIPARSQTLRRERWLPLPALLDFNFGSSELSTRKNVDIFYAESWALVDMLITSPQYASHFHRLIDGLSAGSDAPRELQQVYGKPLDEIRKDLENWTSQPQVIRLMPDAEPAGSSQPRTSELPERQAAILLAQLALVSGHVEQAKVRFEELSRQAPEDPEPHAALGSMALRQGNRPEALVQWRQAVNSNVTDAQLCYRYALLAEEAQLGAQEVKGALQKAIALAPGFDDARYKLALLENHDGEYRYAVEQLRAMQVPAGERRYAYWIALASALTELGQREEAKDAAHQAMRVAATDADQLRARQMAITAVTDMTVQFSTDAEGHSRMVTTRVPHGTADWNPFIEASDYMQRTSGKLREVFCAAGRLSGFLLLTPDGPLTVEVPDPLHVLMRNNPGDFFCGPLQERSVEADYAIVKTAGKTRNVLRGMTFQ